MDAQTTYYSAKYITGTDEQDNEFIYYRSHDCLKSEAGWEEYTDSKNEQYISEYYFNRWYLPNVTLVRFGELTLTRYQWEKIGKPERLSADELRELDQPDSVTFYGGDVIYTSCLPADNDDIPF